MAAPHAPDLVTGHLAAPSPFSLDTLKQTHKYLPIRGLKVDKVHRDGYVILQVSSVDSKTTGIFATTQDQAGDEVRFGLYNFISPIAFAGGDASWSLDVGAKFVVVEPYLRRAKDGKLTLRCDNPSHIVWINEQPLSSLWRNLEWTRHISASALGDDPHHFKALGNGAFKRSDFGAAARFYTKALSAADRLRKSGPDANLIVTLLSNRSEAFLKMQHHRLALRDAGLALDVDPSHVKSMYRKARSQMNLNLFGEALSQVKKGLELDPGNSALAGVHEELTRRQSVPRSASEIDFSGMMQAASRHAGGEVKLMWPDYNGPIEVKDTCTDRGRGTFATETLHPGQVILVEKALAAIFPSWLQHYSSCNLDHNCFQAAADKEIVWRLVEACRSSARMNAAVESLYNGINRRIAGLDEPLSPEAGEGGSNVGVIDVSHIEVVTARYTFSLETLHLLKKSLASAIDTQPTSGHGVWHKAGLINHSCQPNCNRFIIGDMMAVSVLEKINAGEEVTISYVPVTANVDERTGKLATFGFECRCSLCQLEKNQEKRIEQLSKRFDKIAEKLTSQPENLKNGAVGELRALEEDLTAMSPAAAELLWRVRNHLCTALLQRGEMGASRVFFQASFSAFRYGERPTPCEILPLLKEFAAHCYKLSDPSRAEECDRMALEDARKMFGNADAVVNYFFEK